MAVDHRTTVALFEKAAQSDDPEIAAFAHRTLPTLRHHLRVLQEGRKVVR
jgi:putative membrane protein